MRLVAASTYRNGSTNRRETKRLANAAATVATPSGEQGVQKRLPESFGRGIVRVSQKERRLETPEDDRGNNENGHQQREHGDQDH